MQSSSSARETSSFVQFLQISTTESFKRKLTVIDKHQALQKIGNKRKKTGGETKSQSSYDEDIKDLSIDNLSMEHNE